MDPMLHCHSARQLRALVTPYMKQGFENLQAAPQWFTWAMYASSGQLRYPDNERTKEMSFKLSRRSLDRLEGDDEVTRSCENGYYAL